MREQWKTNSTVRIRGRLYRIQEQLGRWHRPRYLAIESGSQRRCLILRLRHDEVSRQHLRVLRRVGHRHGLPGILDIHRDSDQLLIVTTYQPGVDLQQYLDLAKQHRVIAPSAYESVRLIRGLAHGLCHLHRHTQLIHGDLKPANIIITRKPAHLFMIDFGSAWQIEQTTVRHPGDGFELVYTAPEHIQSSSDGDFQRVDGRADQFSVMVILYQLLTGVVPFDGLGGQAGLPQFAKHADLSLIPASDLSTTVQQLPKSIRKQLDRVISTGLALDPTDRFLTTSSWVDELESQFLKIRFLQTSNDPGRWQQWVDKVAQVFTRLPACRWCGSAGFDLISHDRVAHGEIDHE